MKEGGGGAFFPTPPHSFTCVIFRAVFDCLILVPPSHCF